MLGAKRRAPFAPGAALFTLRSEPGAGAFVLRARIAAPILVHVLERDVGAYLSLAPSSDLALAGAKVHLVARLGDGKAVLKATSVTGRRVAPRARPRPSP